MNKKFLFLILILVISTNFLFAQIPFYGSYSHRHIDTTSGACVYEPVYEDFVFNKDSTFNYSIRDGNYDTCGCGRFRIVNRDLLVLMFEKIPPNVDTSNTTFEVLDSSIAEGDSIVFKIYVVDKLDYQKNILRYIEGAVVVLTDLDDGKNKKSAEISKYGFSYLKIRTDFKSAEIFAGYAGYLTPTVTLYNNNYNKTIRLYLSYINFLLMCPLGTAKGFRLKDVTPEGFYLSKDGGGNWLYFKKK